MFEKVELKSSVPPSTLTVPVLLKVTPIVVVPLVKVV